ncbi:MAG: tripartite tricarboxylate transporter substrate binding protein [Betaproteobacteria bacterium]|nr:tripartite tricarboxylate transporter substrate binding protein [Betaproteobacteria bacterium]
MKSALNRTACAALLALSLLTLAAGAALAQYPSKPLRWLIPFSAGGPTDVLARAIAPKLGEALGQTVVVENRVGAGGSLAMDSVAKAAPDGYTIGMGHTGTQAINPHIYAKLPYDPLKDFAPITPVVSYVNVLVVNPNVPARTVGELVAYAKANPDKVSFASGGTGATNHLSGELLKSLTGAPLLHVPYKGSAPALVDVLAGNATCMFDILVTSLPQIRAGRVRALAVTSSKRSGYAPDIPTMAEAGVQGYGEAGSDLWFGVFAPAGTPKPIVDRLNAELVKALHTPEVSERIRAQAYDTWTLAPEEFATFLRADHAKWGKVVKLSGAKAD